MLINLGSIVNMIWGDIYDHLMSTRIVTLMKNKVSISSEKHEANGYEHNLDVLIVFHE